MCKLWRGEWKTCQETNEILDEMFKFEEVSWQEKVRIEYASSYIANATQYFNGKHLVPYRGPNLCWHCKKTKNQKDMRTPGSTSRHIQICKECHKEQKKRLYRESVNKQKAEVNFAERAKEKRKLKYNNKLLNAAKHRAAKAGREFNLRPEDIIIPEKCPILGISLTLGEGRPHAGSPSLDRIDNSRGYVKGNVEIISFRANSLKRDHSFEEVERLYQYMKKHMADTHES